MNAYDKIIIGAGLYGFYAALFSARKGERVLVLEYDEMPFSRATYVNQARVHYGYHYPRSLSTSTKSAGYFKRFNEEYKFCIHSDFRKVYATSAKFSWTNAEQFSKFCRASHIRCDKIDPLTYFQSGACDGAFGAEECTYDAVLLREYFLTEIAKYSGIECRYGVRIQTINKNSTEKSFEIVLASGETVKTGFLLNASYASVNQVISQLGFEPFPIKYELCEIIVCQVDEGLKNVGITVMDGPFFSIMPFGKTGFHSLTSVTFTPHVTCYEALPNFSCQKNDDVECSTQQLGNCNNCPRKPHTAWAYMSTLAKKYLRSDIDIQYVESLFSVKPILKASEIDDSRPTIIRTFSENPTFMSVLSGKINTVYDLDEVL